MVCLGGAHFFYGRQKPVKDRRKSPPEIVLLLGLLGLVGGCGLCLLASFLLSNRVASPDLSQSRQMLASAMEASLPTPASFDSPAPTVTLTPFSPLIATQTPLWTPTASPTITPSPDPTLPEGEACLPSNSEPQTAVLRRVIDGDTIEVELADGALYRVRYIGINAPGSTERLFLEASTANSELLAGKTILLVKDVSQVDRYDRLLRYVLAGDVFVNYELVRLGLAEPGSYPPDTACDETFFGAALTARQAGLGIWAPLVAPPADAAPAGGERGNCDPAYPTVCIPPYPPDLDCKDIPYRRFQVNPPDPHFFDGDYDGLGCEG
jgi:micrococcal nuclease